MFSLHHASSILIREKGSEHDDKSVELKSLIDVKLKRGCEHEFHDSRKEINLITLFRALVYLIFFVYANSKCFIYDNGKGQIIH